ncbi:MAG: hypothetical protein V3V00_04045 [Saprospiraceae bacterium]
MKKANIIFSSIFILFYSISFSQDVTKTDPNPTLFQHLFEQKDDVPTMILHTKVKELFKNKSISEEYYIPGTMTISQPDGSELSFTMEAKIRGNTRKKVCNNAPIKLDLKKKELTALNLNKEVDKIKLVLQCENHPRNFQQLLKEKLIYDLYEAIDSNSMQIKLIKLQMFEDGKMKEKLNAFIVEDEETYANRKNARIIETGKINYAALPRYEYFRLCFFQYMIANCDWSIANKHNIELVKLPDAKQLVSVPYDFDYAGLVNNSYAVPPEHFSITSVTERYFMIRTQMTKEEVDTVIDYYEGMKDTFLGIVASQEFMDDKTKKNVTSFLEGFYKSIKKRNRVLKAVKPRTK